MPLPQTIFSGHVIAYQRHVLEHIFEFDREYGSLLGQLVTIDDRGLWIQEQPVHRAIILEWSYLLEIDEPGSPDPRTTPVIPFPFTAYHLAMFLLGGPGYFVTDYYGEFDTGPDEEALEAFPPQAIKAKEAIRHAYDIIRHATTCVPPLPEEIKARFFASRSAFQQVEDGLRAQGLRGKALSHHPEYSLALAAHREAMKAHDLAKETHTRAMARFIYGQLQAALQGVVTTAVTAIAAPLSVPVTPTAGAATHKMPTSRRSSLAAVHKLAMAKALDPEDWTSVWDALVAIAEAPDRPAPLLGYVESEGIQYRTDKQEEPVKFHSRDAFRKGFCRMKSKSRPS